MLRKDRGAELLKDYLGDGSNAKLNVTLVVCKRRSRRASTTAIHSNS
jgi:hypothetical protein